MRIDKAVVVTCLMPVLVAFGATCNGSGGGPIAQIFLAASIAGTIGTLVDWMAVEMVFARHWWIPFSGVLPRNKAAICEDIAGMVEREWFTPDAVRDHLERADVVTPLREAAERLLLSSRVQERLQEHLLGSAAERLRDPETALFVEREVDEGFGRWLEAWPAPFKRLGVTHMGRGVVRGLELPARVRAFVFDAADRALERAARGGSLRGALAVESRRLLSRLITPELESEVKEALVNVIFARVKVGEVVRRNLETLSADEIRRMVESKARTHLEWIRVNGAIGGFLLGGCLEASRLALGLA